MRKTIAILLLLLSFASKAQNDKNYVDNLVSDFTKSLENRGIEDYFYMYEYCLGTIEMFKLADGSRCTSKGSYYEVYVFWIEENQAMIKKIDNCGLYFSLPLRNHKIVDFAKSNATELDVKVKKYEVENPENVPKQSSTVYACSKMFQFNIKNKTFGQTYNLYQLTNESKYKNINFDYNNNLKIVALEKLIKKEIQETESTFRRQF